MSRFTKLKEKVKENKKEVLFIVLVFFVIGMFIPDEEERATEQEPIVQEEVKAEVETEKEVETEVEEEKEIETKPVVQEESTKEEKEKIEKEERMDKINSAIDLIEASADSNYDYYSVDYDEKTDTIVLSVANDGIAMALTSVKNGLLDKSNWEGLMDGIDLLSETLKEQIDNIYNIEGIDISVAVLNDLDKEKILYLSTNGYGLYDALGE